MATFQKRGNKWRFRTYYYDVNGIRKAISRSGFKTKAEAKRAAIEVENALNKGMKENKNYLLDEWL
ncbi:TPA: Arm DNA-binding domain-containing protein, partial [Staphylococcus delphini]|nr:Arm DNA-binding domain-containing protein [Staphylococcus delphini]HEC2198664.1 Arm DNA-binding domain-containing protein [Staphylococcus delphini]